MTDDNFKENILERQGLAVVDFWAEWCGPCKVFGPIFEEAEEGFKNVQFGKLDVDKNGDTAQELGIRSIPTVVFFKDGTEIDRFTGMVNKDDFIAKIQEHVQ